MIRRFLFELVGMISSDRNYLEVVNLLFVLPVSFYLNIIKTEEMLQKILDVRGTSFQRNRLTVSYFVSHFNLESLPPKQMQRMHEKNERNIT